MFVEVDVIIWGLLLGVCKIYLNIDLVEVVVKKFLEFESKNFGYYILFFNIYVLKGRWYNVIEVRKKMKVKKVSKFLGCSWIEVDKEVYMFSGGDSESYFDYVLILRKLESLSGRLREVGYYLDCSFFLYDLDEEDKV